MFDLLRVIVLSFVFVMNAAADGGAAAPGAAPVATANANAPVTFETSDFDVLYTRLSAKPAKDLDIVGQRQLALLVLMRTGQQKPPTAEVVTAAKKQLADIVAASGDDPEVVAIAANVRAMEAGLAGSPMAALVISKEVTRTFDRLVRDHPANGGVLMQRGSNALYSPQIAGRGSIAVADFEKLVSGDFGLDTQTRLRTLELLGRAYEKVGRLDDARRTYTELSGSDIAYWQTQGQTLLGRLKQ